MILESKPLAEITEEAILLLCRELGIVNTIRFVNQFTMEDGDYTKDKDQIFGQMTIEEMINNTKQDNLLQK